VTKPTINQVLQQAVDAHKAGQTQEAHRLYSAILKVQPQHPDANHNTGLLTVGFGKIELALPFFKTALEANPNIAQFWYSHIVALIKLDKLIDAKALLDQAKTKGIKGTDFDQLEQKLNDAGAYYNMGIALQEKNNLEEAIEAYNKALSIKPDYTNAYYNMGIALKNQGKSEEAIEAYNKAITLKSDYVEAYYNMGVALQEQGKMEEAIKAYNKAIALKSDYVKAYNNMGVVLQEQGKMEEAIKAYNKAITIKPDYAEAYNNMGNALQEQGKMEEAIKAYNKAITIKPDYAEANRHLSLVTKYKSDTAQISEVEALLQRTDLKTSDRCHLLYTYAKMQEDLGNLSAAFGSYVAGGELRQKLLAYEFTKDEHMFDQIKKTAPLLKDYSISLSDNAIRHTPIFILGMPRSGTTLVEQIVSSHTQVKGAGELDYTTRFGIDLAIGKTTPDVEPLHVFRERYLVELAKKANGQAFITDKLPGNFVFIALICAAFPEAKIVNVKRNAEATCWSNFKHYFSSKGLGYSYNLTDTVKYYRLYKDLMDFWYQRYNDRIYNLDYDMLTEDQEPETRRLIEHLQLSWQDACLAPNKNKRVVKTASQQQIRQKVYKGSSQAWRQYEPFLNHAFDGLKP